jgi:hypothetical protein
MSEGRSPHSPILSGAAGAAAHHPTVNAHPLALPGWIG